MKHSYLVLAALIACGQPQSDSAPAPGAGPSTGATAVVPATLRATTLAVSGSASVGGVLVAEYAAVTSGFLATAGCVNCGSRPVCHVGVLPFGVELDDWVTSCPKGEIVQVRASDDWGTLITGIDATGYSVGDELELCNFDAPNDLAVIVFPPEGSASQPANRIHIPTTNSHDEPQPPAPWTVTENRWTLAPDSCVDLVRAVPDPSIGERWMVKGGNDARIYNAAVEALELFPDDTPASVTGTVQDYAPVDTCPQVGGPSGGNCAGGASGSAQDYTVYNLRTVDGTGATIASLYWPGEGSVQGLGPLKLLVNNGPGPVTVKHLGAAAVSTDDVYFASQADYVLRPGDTLLVYHNAHENYWTPVGTRATGQCSSGQVMAGLNADGSLACVQIPSGTPGHVFAGLTSDASTDHLDPSGLHAVVPVFFTTTTDHPAQVLGMDAGVDGEKKELCNFGSGPVVVENEAGATATEWFALYGRQPVTLPGAPGQAQPASCMVVRYDGTYHLWVEIAGPSLYGVSSGTPTVNAGTLAAGSTDSGGTVTGVGGTAMSISFSRAWPNGSSCTASVAVVPGTPQLLLTPSTTNSVSVYCYSVAGTPVNCEDFSYHCVGR